MENKNMRWYDQVKDTPAEAKKPIVGGRLNGKTDINPMWRIKQATQIFGPCGIGWKPVITKQELITHGDEVKAFVAIDLYIKDGDQWSDPIPGLGGSSFVSKEKGGLYVSDECFKMAFTDALGSAFKLIGMSADVYWAQGSKYDTMADAPATNAPANNAQNVNRSAKKLQCPACNRPLTEEEARKGLTHFDVPLCEPCADFNWDRRVR